MARKRFRELDIERRETLLEAAAAEFSARGYEAASVNRIIGEAGISKGSLYYYFEDKEDLFGTVMEQAMTRMMEGMDMPSVGELDADTFWNTFRDLMRRSVDYLKANEWYIRLARSFHQRRLEAPASPAASRVIEMIRNQLHEILARGQELNVVRSDLPLPMLVDVGLAVDEAGDRWRLEHWDEYSDDQRVAQADAQIDLIRDMLHANNQGWEEES